MAEVPLPWINQASQTAGQYIASLRWEGTHLFCFALWYRCPLGEVIREPKAWREGGRRGKSGRQWFPGINASPLNLKGTESKPRAGEPPASGCSSFFPVPVLLGNIETDFNILTPWTTYLGSQLIEHSVGPMEDRGVNGRLLLSHEQFII